MEIVVVRCHSSPVDTFVIVKPQTDSVHGIHISFKQGTLHTISAILKLLAQHITSTSVYYTLPNGDKN